MLPISLVILSFLLKLVIGRDPKVPDLVQNLVDLPCDIGFISLSFVISGIIASIIPIKDGLLITFIMIIGIVLIVYIIRKSIRNFDANRKKVVLSLSIVSYILSGASLIWSITLI